MPLRLWNGSQDVNVREYLQTSDCFIFATSFLLFIFANAAQQSLQSIEDRVNVRNAIMAQDIPEALAKINEINPKVRVPGKIFLLRTS